VDWKALGTWKKNPILLLDGHGMLDETEAGEPICFFFAAFKICSSQQHLPAPVKQTSGLPELQLCAVIFPI
jgi:hypothetical protein